MAVSAANNAVKMISFVLKFISFHLIIVPCALLGQINVIYEDFKHVYYRIKTPKCKQ